MKRLLLILLVFIPVYLQAQEKVARWGVKVSPQHMLVSTMRFEAERVLTEKAISLTLAPYVIWGDLWEDHRNDDIAGVGGEFSGRIYFAKTRRNMNGFYASYGANYTYYSTTARTRDWKTGEEDGLEVIRYGLINKHVDLHKVGVVCTMGYQFNFNNVLLLDFYAGFGLKRCYSPQGDFGLKRYDNHFLDLSYTGFDPRIGYKIGFVL